MYSYTGIFLPGLSRNCCCYSPSAGGIAILVSNYAFLILFGTEEERPRKVSPGLSSPDASE